MNMRHGLGSVWQALHGGLDRARAADAGNAAVGFDGGYGMANSVWRGLSGRSLEIAEVQEEVAAETRGQVLAIGPHDAANRWLLARLRGQPPVPAGGPVYREGFFSLVALPTELPDGRARLDGDTTPPPDEVMGLVSEADVVMYVFTRGQGWRAADARWYARLRATGTPLVLVEVDLPPDLRSGRDLPPDPLPFDRLRAGSGREGEGSGNAWQGATGRATLPAGERPVTVCLSARPDGCETPADVVALVDRILAQRQRLAIPLAQEIPGCRPMIAGRTIRSGMLMAALLGAEPIPLLDLPLQVALNWKLALQLAAIYGHPGLDYRSREMIGTVAWNLGLRYLIQQALKLIPVLGWAASAGLSGLGAWLFGNAVWRHYQEDGRWLPATDKLQTVTHAWRQGMGRWREAMQRRASQVRLTRPPSLRAGIRRRSAAAEPDSGQPRPHEDV